MSSVVGSEIVLEKAKIKKLLKALSEPLRLQIIEALSSGEKCVCDLIQELGLAQSKISFHLKVLKEAELIIDRHHLKRNQQESKHSKMLDYIEALVD